MFGEDRGIFIGLGVGLLALIAIVGGVTITMNNNCQSAFWDTLQVYPGAERVSQQADFFGIQKVVYYTPDAIALVNEWYRNEHAEQMRDALESVNMDLLPNQDWVVEPSEDREGSTLWLQTQCP